MMGLLEAVPRSTSDDLVIFSPLDLPVNHGDGKVRTSEDQ